MVGVYHINNKTAQRNFQSVYWFSFYLKVIDIKGEFLYLGSLFKCLHWLGLGRTKVRNLKLHPVLSHRYPEWNYVRHHFLTTRVYVSYKLSQKQKNRGSNQALGYDTEVMRGVLPAVPNTHSRKGLFWVIFMSTWKKITIGYNLEKINW